MIVDFDITNFDETGPVHGLTDGIFYGAIRRICPQIQGDAMLSGDDTLQVVRTPKSLGSR